MSDWFVEPYTDCDPDSGNERTVFKVMCPTPETWPNGKQWRGTGCWGDAYDVARYSDEAAAIEHARTHRKPYGYG